jgi:hypothetical protein
MIRLIVLFGVFLATTTNAKSPSPSPSPRVHGRSVGRKKTSTLDFDADVIQGNRKSPDFFLQGESQRIGTDAFVFIRNDFNDFHAADRVRRPHLSQ